MSNLSRRDPLDEFFRGFFVHPIDHSTAADAPAIKLDVKEDAEMYHVHAELPGVKKEDIHVRIDGTNVAISAERKQAKEVKDGERILRTERYFGQVSRSFQLAHEIDDVHAVAKFNDGVLELSLPKKSMPQSKLLNIQ